MALPKYIIAVAEAYEREYRLPPLSVIDFLLGCDDAGVISFNNDIDPGLREQLESGKFRL